MKQKGSKDMKKLRQTALQVSVVAGDQPDVVSRHKRVERLVKGNLGGSKYVVPRRALGVAVRLHSVDRSQNQERTSKEV
jgi:hypothetical protein